MIDDAMDADRLVQQALEHMNAGDSDRAKALLKKAATAAPLRADIRDLLVQVMARRLVTPGEKGPREKGASAAPPASAQGARFWLWMTVGAFCLLLMLGGIGVAGYYWVGRNFMRDAGSGESRRDTTGIEDVAGTVPDANKDDPNAEKRERLRNQAAEAADQGNYPDAIRIMGTLLATNPPDSRVYEKELARWHFELGKQKYKNDAYSEAIDSFDRAARLDGENSDYYFWTGHAHFMKGRKEPGRQKDRELQAAEKALVEAVRLDPNNLKAYDALAKTYIGLGRKIPDGRNCYYEIITRAPDSPEAAQAKKDLRDMGLR